MPDLLHAIAPQPAAPHRSGGAGTRSEPADGEAFAGTFAKVSRGRESGPEAAKAGKPSADDEAEGDAAETEETGSPATPTSRTAAPMPVPGVPEAPASAATNPAALPAGTPSDAEGEAAPVVPGSRQIAPPEATPGAPPRTDAARTPPTAAEQSAQADDPEAPALQRALPDRTGPAPDGRAAKSAAVPGNPPQASARGLPPDPQMPGSEAGNQAATSQPTGARGGPRPAAIPVPPGGHALPAEAEGSAPDLLPDAHEGSDDIPARTGPTPRPAPSAPAVPPPAVAAPAQPVGKDISTDRMSPEIAPEIAAGPSGPAVLSSTHAQLPAAPPQLAHHVATQIAAALPRADGAILTDRGTEVALDPPELGRIRLIVTEIAGGLSLSVSAERQETLDMFRRHAAMLEAELRREGLADTSFSFRDGAPRGDPDRDSGREDAPIAVEADPARRTAVQSGGLDLRL